MTIDELIAEVKDKSPPAPEEELARFEELIGQTLPEDYRRFLVQCNGGYVGGRFWFQGINPEGEEVEAGVHHIGGFRDESYFSLLDNRECYVGRIPNALIWIHDDPFGNAICLGGAGVHHGRVYFWDHEEEPDEDEWDGAVETADNITLIANSFTDYVAGLRELDDNDWRKEQPMYDLKCQLGLLAAVLLSVAAPARAAAAEEAAKGPLATVQRKIGKEPKYETKPKYALLLLGANAEAKVWLVEDGRRLYVDRNGNGDLTDDGPPVEPSNERKLGASRWDFDYLIGELKPGDGSRHTDFRLARWNYDKPQDGYGMSLTLNGKTPMYAGWTAFWADSPQEAPLFHFGGALEPRKLRGKEFVLGAKRSDSANRGLSFAFINPGSEPAAHTRLSIEAMPAEVIPSVQIDWPVPQGQAPLRTTHVLLKRCCYWEFYTTDFRIPEGVVAGAARVSISLPGYECPLEFHTLEIEVPVVAEQ